MAPDRTRWVVIGDETPGRARAEAIRRHPTSDLVAVAGGWGHDLGAPSATIPEAIDASDGVVLCVPQHERADLVRTAVDAGRHVIVDGPATLEPAGSGALLALAGAADLVLQISWPQLHEAVVQALRAYVRGVGVKRIQVSVEAQGPAEPGAELLRANLVQLHRVVHIGGPIARIDSTWSLDGMLSLALTLSSGAPVAITLEQGPYLTRRLRFEVQDHHTTWRQSGDALFNGRVPQTLLQATRTYDQDHASAMLRIEEGAPPYIQDWQELHVLEVASRVRQGLTGPIAAP